MVQELQMHLLSFKTPFLFIASIAAGTSFAPLSAQAGSSQDDPPQLLNVFLDCHLIVSCDTDHFRREITFDFGSVFNDVVNSRLPRTVRGALF